MPDATNPPCKRTLHTKKRKRMNIQELIEVLREDANQPLNDDGDVISSDSTLIEAAAALERLQPHVATQASSPG